VLLKPFEYEKAESVDEAISMIKDSTDDHRLIAGGTAMVIMLKEKILSPTKLVDISKIGSLRGITFDEKAGLTIGAMTTHFEVESSPIVASRYPSLKEAFRSIGNPRIRAVGTIGGNLAYAEPQCNPPAILAALDATIHVKGEDGVRFFPADDFIKGIFESALEPGEVITHVTVPPPKPRSASVFHKFTTRAESDKPTSTVAIYVELDRSLKRVSDCRIVVGAVGPRTFRCPKAEGMMKAESDASRAEFAAVAKVASEEFEPMDDLYGPAWYKKQVTTSLIRDSLKEAVDAAKKVGA
jgi:aerobic carbon-monoxide dehydrogenase medium subunit